MTSRERIETEFSIASYEADLHGRLSLFALFNRFQDLAGLHATELQVGFEQLHTSQLAWVLSRIKVRIESWPRWGDSVRLSTWPKGIDRLFALRDFSLVNERGKTLAVATSAWLLIDAVKGRPQRFENYPVDLRFPGAPHAIDELLDKIVLPDGATPVFERPVWQSDIDVNQHVNNAQYAKMVGDSFPEESFRSRRLSALQINYVEEGKMGDTIRLMRAPTGQTGTEYVVWGVNVSKNSTVFQAVAQWV